MNSHSLGLGVCSKFPGVCDELMLSYQNRHFFSENGKQCFYYMLYSNKAGGVTEIT